LEHLLATGLVADAFAATADPKWATLRLDLYMAPLAASLLGVGGSYEKTRPVDPATPSAITPTVAPPDSTSADGKEHSLSSVK
jgi:hypothetical protein